MSGLSPDDLAYEVHRQLDDLRKRTQAALESHDYDVALELCQKACELACDHFGDDDPIFTQQLLEMEKVNRAANEHEEATTLRAQAECHVSTERIGDSRGSQPSADELSDRILGQSSGRDFLTVDPDLREPIKLHWSLAKGVLLGALLCWGLFMVQAAFVGDDIPRSSIFESLGAGIGVPFGIAVVVLGWKGYTREGIPLTASRVLRGRPAELVGTFVLMIGVVILAEAGMKGFSAVRFTIEANTLKRQALADAEQREQERAREQHNAQRVAWQKLSIDEKRDVVRTVGARMNRTLPDRFLNESDSEPPEDIKAPCYEELERRSRAASILAGMGISRSQLMSPGEKIAEAEEAVNRAVSDYNANPQDDTFLIRLAEAHHRAGGLYRAAHELDEKGHSKAAYELLAARVSSGTADVPTRQAFGEICWQYADSLDSAPDSLPVYQAGIDALMGLEGLDTSAAQLSTLGALLSNQANALLRAGRVEEACAGYRQAARYQRGATELQPSVDRYRKFLVIHYQGLADTSIKLRRVGAAVEAAQQIAALCNEDASRLYEAARHLAGALVLVEAGSHDDKGTEIDPVTLKRQTVDLLGRALIQNSQLLSRLQADQGFEVLKSDEDFQSLLRINVE